MKKARDVLRLPERAFSERKSDDSSRDFESYLLWDIFEGVYSRGYLSALNT